jgi:hypothetical protein
MAALRVFRALGMMEGTTASYTAMIHAGGKPQSRSTIEGDVDEDNDNGPSAGPKTLSTVELARHPGTYLFTTFSLRP